MVTENRDLNSPLSRQVERLQEEGAGRVHADLKARNKRRKTVGPTKMKRKFPKHKDHL